MALADLLPVLADCWPVLADCWLLLPLPQVAHRTRTERVVRTRMEWLLRRWKARAVGAWRGEVARGRAWLFILARASRALAGSVVMEWGREAGERARLRQGGEEQRRRGAGRGGVRVMRAWREEACAYRRVAGAAERLQEKLRRQRGHKALGAWRVAIRLASVAWLGAAAAERYKARIAFKMWAVTMRWVGEKEEEEEEAKDVYGTPMQTPAKLGWGEVSGAVFGFATPSPPKGGVHQVRALTLCAAEVHCSD